MNFYKNVIEHRGKLLVRGIHEGKEYKNKIDFSPSLYAITQEDSKFKTIVFDLDFNVIHIVDCFPEPSLNPYKKLLKI